MDLSRLTEQSQEAIRRAQALALRRNHQGIDTPHLLAALLEEAEGLPAGILAAAGIAPSALRECCAQVSSPFFFWELMDKTLACVTRKDVSPGG